MFRVGWYQRISGRRRFQSDCFETYQQARQFAQIMAGMGHTDQATISHGSEVWDEYFGGEWTHNFDSDSDPAYRELFSEAE